MSEPINPSIEETRIHTYQTSLIPVYREQTKERFCEYTQPWHVDLDGEVFQSNYLKPGIPISLLGISQTQKLIETGILDSTDSVDPAIWLEEIVLHIPIGGQSNLIHVHKFVTENGPTPLTAFNYHPMGNYRVVEVNFIGQIALPTGEVVRVDGHGSVNLELSDTEVMFRVESQSGDIEVVGYKLNAKRVNYNRHPA